MSVEFKTKDNLHKMLEQLESVSKKKWPHLISQTTKSVSEKVKNKLKQEMPAYLDRPNPYTINSLFAFYGNKSKPESTVKWKRSKGTSAGHYLVPQVDGQGIKRPLKPFERKLQSLGLMPKGWVSVPGQDMRTDPYGNIPAPTLYKIVRGVTQTKIKVSKKGKVINGTTNGGYYVSFDGSGVEAGIYERKKTAFGEALRLVIAYIPEARYKRKFPFYGIGQSVAGKTFDGELKRVIEQNKAVS